MTPSPYMSASADISPDGVYRYSLSRRLSRGDRAVLFVGLNPSFADATTDDPTIRRCAGFARLWGFDWLLIGNVYALRSTNPKGLMLVEDPIGPNNERALKGLTGRAELVVAAWGGNRLHASAERLAAWILSLEQTRCLGENQDGSPKHPLYLRRETELRKPVVLCGSVRSSAAQRPLRHVLEMARVLGPARLCETLREHAADGTALSDK